MMTNTIMKNHLGTNPLDLSDTPMGKAVIERFGINYRDLWEKGLGGRYRSEAKRVYCELKCTVYGNKLDHKGSE